MTDLPAQLLAAYADEHREHLAGLRAVLAAGLDADFEEAYRHAHSLKGAARAIGVAAVEAIAHRLETIIQAVWDQPSRLDGPARRVVARALDAIEDLSAAALAAEPVPASHRAVAELDRLLAGRELDIAVTPAPPHAGSGPAPAPLPGATLRVEAQAADRLLHVTAELLARVGRHQRVVTELRALHGEIMALQESCRIARGAARGAAGAEMQAACVLADHVARGHDRVASALVDLDWDLSLLSDRVRTEVHHLRLVSADSQLAGYARMARELAADQGKEVMVELEGLEAQADRDVLQPLGEAVMHLLRNAVTHGIELPAERLAAGKPAAGLIRLSVRAEAGRLTLRVQDDGRGLDVAAIARRAVAGGLLGEEEAGRRDPDTLRQLVFEPGLSTAGAVSAFAGRGMGLPIVRRVVTRLQGTVEARPAEGGGAVVTLRVPVTVMAQRVVLARAGGQMFALPSVAVQRLAVVAGDSLVPVDGQPGALVDGGECRLVDLGGLLGLAPVAAGPAVAVAILSQERPRLGLVVESFADVRDLPVAALEAPLAEHPLLAGTVLLDDGRLVLVLAPAGLAAAARPGAGAPGPPAVRAEPPLVLVVDDSITTRTLEKSILESHGYRVDLAVDGRQALELLAQRRPTVVVSDIEMPRLDGFGLLAAMKRSRDWRDIPVVLVSSRDSATDRERGLRLGAGAYIVKTRFDQDDLLEAIGRLA